MSFFVSPFLFVARDRNYCTKQKARMKGRCVFVYLRVSVCEREIELKRARLGENRRARYAREREAVPRP